MIFPYLHILCLNLHQVTSCHSPDISFSFLICPPMTSWWSLTFTTRYSRDPCFIISGKSIFPPLILTVSVRILAETCDINHILFSDKSFLILWFSVLTKLLVFILFYLKWLLWSFVPTHEISECFMSPKAHNHKDGMLTRNFSKILINKSNFRMSIYHPQLKLEYTTQKWNWNMAVLKVYGIFTCKR